MKNLKPVIAFSVLICCMILTSGNPVAKNSTFGVIDTIHIGGKGGWDYCAINYVTNQLFVTHDTCVNVIDLAKRNVAGTIGGLKGTHGVAFVNDLNKAYITSGKDTCAAVVDLKTLSVSKRIKVTGAGPDGITYDPFSKKVFVFNGKTANASVIDPKSDSIVGTIALDGKPEFSAVNGHGLLYVNIEDKDSIDVIDTKAMQVVRRYSVAPAKAPSAMAIDTVSGTLFIGCGGTKQCVVLNYKTGAVLATLPIGDHVDAAAFDPELHLAFTSNGEGTVTVIQKSKDTYKVLETIMTQKGSKTMALNTKTHHLYLPAAEYDPASAPTAENPKPRAIVKAGSFCVLEVAPVEK